MRDHDFILVRISSCPYSINKKCSVVIQSILRLFKYFKDYQLVPCLNEMKHIEDFYKSVLKQTKKFNEIIFLDGGSDDGTLNFIDSLNDENVILVHNKKKFVAHGLNLGISMARGEIIIRLDVHCDYPDNYFDNILDTFKKTGADIVGGPTCFPEKNLDLFQSSVANIFHTKFSSFRF